MASAPPLVFLALVMMLASATASPPAFVDKTKVHPLRPNNGKGQPGPEEPEEDDTRSDAGLFGGSGGCNIVYHSLANGEGAPVILGTPNVYYIFYGDKWSEDTVGQDVLINLAKNIGGSPWYNIQTTYYQQTTTTSGGRKSRPTTTTTYISNSVAYKASTSVSDSTFTKNITNQNVVDIVLYVLGNGLLPVDASGVYFVLTASDVTNVDGFCTGYCGYHSFAAYNGVNIKLSFVGNPGELCPYACSDNPTKSITGSLGADAMASILAHELAEAVSDPELNAWFDCNGYENADKCAWTFGTTYITGSGAKANMKLGAYDYLIQQNWVAAGKTQRCALSY